MGWSEWLPPCQERKLFRAEDWEPCPGHTLHDMLDDVVQRRMSEPGSGVQVGISWSGCALGGDNVIYRDV